jgi:hypothetical protein
LSCGDFSSGYYLGYIERGNFCYSIWFWPTIWGYCIEDLTAFRTLSGSYYNWSIIVSELSYSENYHSWIIIVCKILLQLKNNYIIQFQGHFKAVLPFSSSFKQNSFFSMYVLLLCINLYYLINCQE